MSKLIKEDPETVLYPLSVFLNWKLLVAIARLCETLSKVEDRTRELVVPHHPVQRLDVVVTGARLHPVCVEKFDASQPNRLYPGVDLLHGQVVVLLRDGDLYGKKCYIFPRIQK